MKGFEMRLLGIYVFLISCCPPWQQCKEIDNNNDVKRDDTEAPYKVVWQTSLFGDTLYSITDFKPILFEDLVIFSRRKGPAFSEEIVAFDKRTGEKRWEWTEEVRNYVFTDEYMAGYISRMSGSFRIV